jgi:hypothetical protein
MTRSTSCALLLLAGLLAASPAFAIQQGVSGQVRQYGTHRYFEDRPFVGGDIGYGAAYEIRDEMGFWQLGALYIPDAGTDSTYDYAATPFLNLIIKERSFLLGVGILQTYTSGSADDEWSDLYWNLLTGLEFPVGDRLSVTGLAIYDFEGWNTLNDFRFEDVEFAASLNFLF